MPSEIDTLLAKLETYYPDTMPMTELPPFELARLQGQRDVVIRIKQLIEE